jgi:putative transposase
MKKGNQMEEHPRSVARLADGGNVAPPCREFGIRRKTGHMPFNRCKEHGHRGLEDRAN